MIMGLQEEPSYWIFKTRNSNKFTLYFGNVRLLPLGYSYGKKTFMTRYHFALKYQREKEIDVREIGMGKDAYERNISRLLARC